jgi:hypothetical protein
MNALNALFALVVSLLIMSYGLGILIGALTGKGFTTANAVVEWELRMLFKAFRWAIGLMLQLFSDISGSLAKKANPPKKKKRS